MPFSYYLSLKEKSQIMIHPIIIFQVIELEKRLAEVLERSSAQSQTLKKEDISEEERRAAVRA